MLHRADANAEATSRADWLSERRHLRNHKKSPIIFLYLASLEYFIIDYGIELPGTDTVELTFSGQRALRPC